MEKEEVAVLMAEDHKALEMATVHENDTVLPITQNCTCSFSGQEDNSHESEERSKSVKNLLVLILIYFVVMLVEIIGGVKANSLAVITDAAHMFTDVAVCLVSLFALWASSWKPTKRQSFGYGRYEIVGALFSVLLIWLVCGSLVYEAVDRILHRSARVNGGLMFVIAAFGFMCNLITVILLGHGHHHGHNHSHHDCHDHDYGHDHNHGHDHNLDHDHHHVHDIKDSCEKGEGEATKLVSSSPVKAKLLNINIQGAYLHAMADLIQSIGVMIAGAVIWVKPHLLLVDLICTFVFSALVLSTTVPMIKKVLTVLTERSPEEINIDLLESSLKGVAGVKAVHDLHVWAITEGKMVLTTHVVAEPGVSSGDLLNRIQDYCKSTFSIHHVTVQIE